MATRPPRLPPQQPVKGLAIALTALRPQERQALLRPPSPPSPPQPPAPTTPEPGAYLKAGDDVFIQLPWASMSRAPIEGEVFFEETIELSRRVRAMKLWLSLRYHGLAAFRESIAGNIEQAQRLARRVDAEPTLERVAEVPLSVNRSIRTSSAGTWNRLKWASRRISSRCSEVVSRIGSTILILNGSMIVRTRVGPPPG